MLTQGLGAEAFNLALAPLLTSIDMLFLSNSETSKPWLSSLSLFSQSGFILLSFFHSGIWLVLFPFANLKKNRIIFLICICRKLTILRSSLIYIWLLSNALSVSFLCIFQKLSPNSPAVKHLRILSSFCCFFSSVICLISFTYLISIKYNLDVDML